MRVGCQINYGTNSIKEEEEKKEHRTKNEVLVRTFFRLKIII